MRKISINGKEYPFKVTLGTLEDLEKRGYSLQQLGQMEGLSVSFLIDVVELACGIDRNTIKDLPLTDLGSLSEEVSEALNESFESVDGNQSGEV